MPSLAEGARSLEAVAKALPEATVKSVKEATELVASSVLVAQGRAGASSGRLRGVGADGARIGVVGKVRDLTGVASAFGPAHLLDHPTRSHVIAPRRKRALATPAGPRAGARSPGTKGKFYFEEGIAVAEPQVGAIFEANTDAALAKALF